MKVTEQTENQNIVRTYFDKVLSIVEKADLISSGEEFELHCKLSEYFNYRVQLNYERNQKAGLFSAGDFS